MRIQLKQNEIEEAIKGFLTRQGIAVGGKAVTMDFTSGRKNNGLSVEVVIEDQVGTVAVDPVYTSTDPYAADAGTRMGYAQEATVNTTDAPADAEVKPAGSLFG